MDDVEQTPQLVAETLEDDAVLKLYVFPNTDEGRANPLVFHLRLPGAVTAAIRANKVDHG